MNELENDKNVNKLLNTIKKQYDIDIIPFREILTKTGALLAGGSVLSSINNEEVQDLDIYVNILNSEELIDYMLSIGFTVNSTFTKIAPAYDQSFMKKNKIFARILLHNKNYRPIDIMLIEESTTPLQVVQNFDLSFCEVWYDSSDNKLKGNLKDAVSKKGYLEPEYTESLLKHFNIFILKRIRKYVKKGYSIYYRCDNIISVCEQVIEIKKPENTVSNLEEWFVKRMYSNLIFQKEYHQFPLNSYKIEDFKKFFLDIFFKEDDDTKIKTWNRMWKKSSQQIFLNKTEKNNKYRDILTKNKDLYNNILDISTSNIDLTNAKCKDMIMYEDFPIITYLEEDKENIIFVMNDKDTIFCYNEEYIRYLTINDDDIFYECTGRTLTNGDKGIQYDNTKEYVKISGNFEGLNILVYREQLFLTLNSLNKYRIFNLEYKNTFTHTISKQAIDTRNYISANHCQVGSNFLVYDIKILEKKNEFESEEKESEEESEEKDSEEESEEKD